MELSLSDIKIQVRLMNSSTMLAQVEVIIFDELEVKGWRVMVSKELHPRFQENIWITPPSYRAGQMFKPVFYINNKEHYSLVEEAIYDAYRRHKLSQPNKENYHKGNEAVDVDKIPF